VRRRLSIALAAVLSVAVVVTIIVSRHVEESSRRAAVYGEVPPEARAFFADPRVRAVFAHHGINLYVGAVGTDFVSTASGPSPTRLSTPLAVLAPTSSLASLARAGVVRNQGFDLARYMSLVRRGEPLPAIASPSITSTTGALFAAAAGAAANGARMPTTVADVDRVVNSVSALFRTSAGGLRVGSEAALLAGAGSDTALLSLEPSVEAVQSFEPKSAGGARVLQLLATDASLRSLAAQHGFVVGGTTVSSTILDALTTRVAATLRAAA
jgi:hypothetical protein